MSITSRQGDDVVITLFKMYSMDIDGTEAQCESGSGMEAAQRESGFGMEQRYSVSQVPG